MTYGIVPYRSVSLFRGASGANLEQRILEMTATRHGLRRTGCKPEGVGWRDALAHAGGARKRPRASISIVAMG